MQTFTLQRVINITLHKPETETEVIYAGHVYIVPISLLKECCIAEMYLCIRN